MRSSISGALVAALLLALPSVALVTGWLDSAQPCNNNISAQLNRVKVVFMMISVKFGYTRISKYRLSIG